MDWLVSRKRSPEELYSRSRNLGSEYTMLHHFYINSPSPGKIYVIACAGTNVLFRSFSGFVKYLVVFLFIMLCKLFDF